MSPLWRDPFERPAIIRAFEEPAIEAPIVIRKQQMEPAPAYRYIAPRPNIGARGGEGNRAKTKAARKANLRRRRGG